MFVLTKSCLAYSMNLESAVLQRGLQTLLQILFRISFARLPKDQLYFPTSDLQLIFLQDLPLTVTYKLAIEKERNGFNVTYIKSFKT
jgi:hypothetical protein